jgi:acetyl-CoA C-acetyltransferase
MGEAWIIDAVRTPRGRGKNDGALAEIHPQELMAQVLNAIKDRNHLNPLDVEDVLVGCVTAHGEQAMCIARMAVLAAAWASPRSSNGFDFPMRGPL